MNCFGYSEIMSIFAPANQDMMRIESCESGS